MILALVLFLIMKYLLSFFFIPMKIFLLLKKSLNIIEWYIMDLRLQKTS